MSVGTEIVARQHASNRTGRTGRTGRTVALSLALVLGVACYGPALRAYFAQDDFAFLAIVRLLHQPWLLFVHDHFPASPYFRPLGVFLWWLVCEFAGSAPRPQYIVNLILHLACVGALYTLLQQIRRDAALNGFWAALYAVHPLAIGTALWLSDRFDLLTTLFSLLAINAALAYAAWPRLRTLGALLASLLLALLSKELGVVAAAVSFAAVLFAPRAALSTRQRLLAPSSITALTVAWLAYRHAMLPPIWNTNGRLPAPSVFVEGSGHWLRAGWTFLAHDPRAPAWSIVLLACAAALWSISACLAWRPRSGRPLRWHVAIALAILILLPGLVQAPVAITHLGIVGSDQFWFSLVVPARFFHLALAGLVCALMLATTPIDLHASRALRSQRLTAFALLLAIVAVAPTAHELARQYARGTRAPAAALAAVGAALERVDPPARSCQIYLLQTDAIWGFFGYSDAIAKGLANAPDRLAHCLVSTERPPWIYFVRAHSVSAADFFPLRPLEIAAQPVAPLVIGDFEAMYLTMGPDQGTTVPAQAIYLEFRNGTFIDVSESVHRGERHVDFVTAP